jgi:NitT/TauT family transport system substrate-binding protein
MLCLGLMALIGVASRAAEGETDSSTATAVRFLFDRPLDGTSAPIMLAQARGYFRSVGLTVAVDVAKNSDDAIARVAAGTSDIALADINALVRFRDKADAPPVKAIFVMFNTAPYAILARKSRGIRALTDIKGKTLGVIDGDLSIRLWPALAERNGLKTETVKQQHIGAAVREPMLSAGQVDAVTGFSYLSAVNLKDRGIPADDLAVLRFVDYGGSAYGAALIVNPQFAASRPKAVQAFIRAVVKGVQQTINDPAAAIDAVMARMNGGARPLELERLRAALKDNIVTPEVRHNGIGAIDDTRFARSIDDIGVDFKFRQKPVVADIFDPTFLPPIAERLVK